MSRLSIGRRPGSGLVLLAAGLCCTAVAAQSVRSAAPGSPFLALAPAAQVQPRIDRLAWLAGCWRAEGGEAGSGEHWLPLAGKTLLGASRTVRDGQTVAHEFMQVRQQADGSVALALQSAGRAEVLLTLLPGAALEAVFENLALEAPQRVTYRLEDAGRLRLRVEGRRLGLPTVEETPLLRTPCDTQPPRPGAFQGLPWGASEVQIAQRFGPALQPAPCPGPGSAAASSAAAPAWGAASPEACDSPLLARYEVAGVPFRLHLQLDDSLRQLVRVALAWAGEAGPGQGSWSDKHRRLRQLLVQRYGNPEATHVDTEGGQQSALARWRVGDTLIELNASSQAASAGAPAREQVLIVYRPVNAGEAARL